MIDRSDAPASLPSRSQERKLSGEFRRVRAPATAYRFDSAGQFAGMLQFGDAADVRRKT